MKSPCHPLAAAGSWERTTSSIRVSGLSLIVRLTAVASGPAEGPNSSTVMVPASDAMATITPECLCC